MRGSVLDTSDLLAITGYAGAGDAARCLRAQCIRVFDGKDGPWTTLELINAAGGLLAPAAQTETYRPEDLV
ncbi:hypothetical protein [Tahibacter sp.]|uniref:hypothetical protein n=1 Tax=Tahibacter sp. TaxID=2056211 RepID=UPI0028C3E81A|nr:hypothetical protein [Tahibacter sp.]